MQRVCIRGDAEGMQFVAECRFIQRVYQDYRWRQGWVHRPRFVDEVDDRVRALHTTFWLLPPGWGKDEVQAYLNRLKNQGVDVGKTTEDVEDVLQAVKDAGYTTYNAFENPDLIPSLYRLVKKWGKKNRKKGMKEWVSQYGALGINDTQGKRESLADFWREAETLADLWEKFQQVTQRDLESLREWIKFVSIEGLPLISEVRKGKTKAEYAPFPPGGGGTVGGPCFYDSLGEIERNPLPYFQLAGLDYILTRVQNRLRGLRAAYSEVERITNPQEDIFKIQPRVVPVNLLQAMYLQFYLLLSDRSVKVCKCCGRLFRPEEDGYRKDRQYCSDSCKLTAKSRRYRERKKG